MERLRIAHSADATETNPKPQASLQTTHCPRRLALKPSLSRLKDSVIQNSKFLQRSAPKSPLTYTNVTQEDALFFSRLPDKVKYSKFSTEERRILTPLKDSFGGIRGATSDSLDEDHGYQEYQSRNRSLPSLQSLYTGPSSPSTFDPDEYSSVYTGEDNMDNDIEDQFQWFETEVDLSLDDYHTHIANAADAKVSPIAKDNIIRKQRSFATLPSEASSRSSSFSRPATPGSGWAPPTERVPPIPRFLPNLQTHTQSSTVRMFRPKGRADDSAFVEKSTSSPSPIQAKSTTQPEEVKKSSQSLDLNPTYYRDPEARLKLRLYMTSDSRFDEALEYGFPSLSNPPAESTSTLSQPPFTTPSIHEKMMSRSTDQRQTGTFLDDSTTNSSVPPSMRDTPMGFQSEVASSSVADDAVSSLDTVMAPSEESFQPSSMHTGNSQPQMSLHEQARLFDQLPVSREWPPREMTLRMTLTRPELRADESLLYPQLTRPDPNVPMRSSSLQPNNTQNSQGSDDLWKLGDLRLGDDAMLIRSGKKKKGLRRLFSRKF